MPVNRLLIGSITAVSAVTAYAYSEHRRLAALYPTLPVPPVLDPQSCTRSPQTSQRWATSDIGDAWIVKLPPGRKADAALCKDWTVAFWSSWPLRLEGSIIGLLQKLGANLISDHGGRKVNVLTSEDLQEGTGLLNGGFTFEAIDMSSPGGTVAEKPPRTILRWGSLIHRPTSNIAIRGGYHTLAIVPGTAFPGMADPHAQFLVFASHGICARPFSQGREERGLRDGEYPAVWDHPDTHTVLGGALAWFHVLYARKLVDLGARGMGLV